MIVKKIELTNFRNFKNVSFEFNNKLNFIYGDNGSGKTSIVEAIYFLSLTRSFRTNNQTTLINDESEYFQIKAEICSDISSNNMLITLNNEGKNIYINDKKINKISDLYYYVNCISYIPKDSFFLKDSPKERRSFLNINLSKLDKVYLQELMKYEKILKSRNELLKQENIDKNLLDVLTTQLINLSYSIDKKRYDYIERINQVLPLIYKQLTNNEINIQIRYKPFIDNLNKYQEIARLKYNESLEKDLQQKVTTIGIQKEDFSIFIGDKNVGIYGSQGENKLAVLSLKLSLYFIDKDNNPIIILDDILAELDFFHQNNLLKMLDSFSQAFITSSKKETTNLNNIWYFHIQDNISVYKEGV